MAWLSENLNKLVSATTAKKLSQALDGDDDDKLWLPGMLADYYYIHILYVVYVDLDDDDDKLWLQACWLIS